MTVSNILARKGRKVVTIEPTASVASAVDLLHRAGIGAVVVTGAEGRVIGILSERDIVRSLAVRGAEMLRAPVSELMTRRVVTCALADTVAEVMHTMTENKFRHLPVLDQGRLVGLVSIGDVVKSRLEQMEQESDALREYIRTA